MRTIVFWLAAASLFSGIAGACVPDDEYDHPTNYELVESAEAIVVATAIAEEAPREDSEPSVRFRTDVVLKGKPTPSFLIYASGLETPPTGAPTPPDQMPQEGCSCADGKIYSTNSQYVLFLQEQNGEFTQENFICAQWSTLYLGERSLWVEAIWAFVDIEAAHDRMGALDALNTLKLRIEADSLDTRRQGLAKDIDEHLRTMSTFKPTAFLIDAFERLERGKTLRFSEKPSDNPENSKRSILRALAHKQHPDAAAFFERILTEYETDPYAIGRAIQYLGNNNAYRRSFEIVETTALPLLIRSDHEGLAFLLQRILDAQNDYDPVSEKWAWQLDPYTAKAWPELALGLYMNVERRSPEDFSTSVYAAIKDIPVTSFVDRPMLTRALADLRDARAADWADNELRDEGKLKAEQKSERSWQELRPSDLAIETLLRADREKDSATLAAVFCQSEDRRRTLVTAFAAYKGSSYRDVFRRMLGSPNLSEDERRKLFSALLKFAAQERYPGDWREMLKEWLWRMDGTPGNLNALKCG